MGREKLLNLLKVSFSLALLALLLRQVGDMSIFSPRQASPLP